MPANTTTVSVRMPRELKGRAEELFADIGLNMTSAILMFLQQAVSYDGIPFEIRRYNAETIAAMREAEEIARHPERYRSYASADELMEDILPDLLE